MDTNRGELAEITPELYKDLKEKKAEGLWQVGDVYEINGTRLKLVKIIKRGRMTFKVLPSIEEEKRRSELKKQLERR